MSKRMQRWISIALFIVAAVVVCLLSGATPEPAETPREQVCPYQMDAQGCSYTND